MNGFRERLIRAIDASPYRKSKTKLAEDAGMGPRSINNMLNNEDLENSKVGPGIFGMARIAELLGVSLDYLAGVNQSKSSDIPHQNSNLLQALEHLNLIGKHQQIDPSELPSVDGLMRLHLRTGGMLDGFEGVLNYCDVYDLYDDATAKVSVRHVGEKSLSGVTMGAASAKTLERAINEVPSADIREKLAKDHASAHQRGQLCTLERLDVQMPNEPIRVRMDYIRALFALKDKDDAPVTLSFCAIVV